MAFWSSVVLTGDQTWCALDQHGLEFWSSVVLTGDQTHGIEFDGTIGVLEQCRSDW